MPGEFGESEAWLACEEQGETRRIDLSRSPLVFGRDSRCEHAFPYQGVSRRHFSLEYLDGAWVITDLESSNGTLVNENRITQKTLGAGDRIGIGGNPKLAPVSWVFHVSSVHLSRFQLTPDSVEYEDDHDTEFALNLAQLEERATSGVMGQSPMPTFGSKGGGVLGEMLRESFSEDVPDEIEAELAAPKEANLPEFDISSAISLFSQMGQALLDSQGIDQLLERTLELVFRNVPAERGSIWLCDLNSNAVTCKAARARDDDQTEAAGISKSIAREAVETKNALLVRQVLTDQRFKNAASIETLQIRSAMCAPLYHQGAVRGFLYVDSSTQTEAFTNHHLGVLTAMAMFTATGIEKIRSVQETIATRNHLQSVLESISHLVLTLDRNGRLQTVNRNPKRQLGIDAERMRSLPYPEWFGGQNLELVELFRTVYQTSQPSYLSDYEILGERGQRSAVNCSVVPLLDFQNSQSGVVAILEDLTREKRMATALGRYLSPTLAHRVMQEGEARLGGVKQKVTVLFSDIRSYTSLTEAMDAQQVVEMLNAYFTEMVEPVFAERGFLDKYIGDALMAVFGVPFTEGDDAVRACRTALGMQRALKTFNARQKTGGLVPLQIGVGLSTGDVISGNIGSEKRLEYTCIGDGVNLASRIEGLTKIYEVSTLVSQFTHQELGDHFVTREVDCVCVLGKRDPIRIYELVAEQWSDLTQVQQDCLECYEQGLEAYRNRDWKAAAEKFHTGIELAHDGPCKIFYLRCQGLIHDPPGKNWDPVYHVERK